MFSKIPRIKSRFSISTRLALRYAFLFFVSNVIFITILFIMINNEFAEKDKKLLKTHFSEISAVLVHLDVQFLLTDFLVNTGLNRDGGFLFRLINDRGQIIYDQLPRGLNNFDVTTVEQGLTHSERTEGYFTIYPKIIGEETIEIFSGRTNGYKIIVGITTDESEDFLQKCLVISIMLMFLSLIFSGIVGYFSSLRALSPIRELIHSMSEAQHGHLRLIHSPSLVKDELTELTEIFNKMILRVNNHISSLQQSLDAIAHDLRTPLTHLSNKLEASLKAKTPTLTEELIYEFIEEVQDMTSLLNTLLELTEADSKGGKIDKAPFDIRTLVSECIEIYEFVAEEKKALISNDVEAHHIYGDRNKIKRVIANLIDNALKYSRSAPQIRLSSAKNENSFLLYVQDKGVGIPTEDLERIWQRLYRGDTSRSTPGMGLGLSFVKAIVESHGWKITVESRPDQGTVFTIHIS